MGDVLGRGIAMTYLSIVALIPLAAVVAKSLDSGLGSFWDAITTDQAIASLKLTLIASVIVASVPDPSVFKSGRDFAAWLGLTPKQNSTGGKAKLGAVPKQGNRYIRKMLVVGSRSALRVAGKRKGALAGWIASSQHLKPGNLMPSFERLPGEELRRIADYLERLE